MYNLYLDGNKWKAELDWGDDFNVMFAITEDSTPVDLTGKEIIFGIKEKNSILVEVNGTVSGNEVVFDMPYSVLSAGGLSANKTYTFDFWNKTDRFTYIEEGSFKTDGVSHNVEV
jgi:hypothetical protein